MSFRNYYDSSSYKNRDTARAATGITTDRPTSVTAKYTTTPSYKTSSIPVLNDRSSRDETVISTIANRYASYGKNATDKTSLTTSKHDKKDYSKIAVPAVSATRSRDPSPITPTLKYSLSRPSRHVSPESKPTKSFKDKHTESNPINRDKDIPSKTDKAQSYSSLSNYKIYPRSSSYTRSVSRTETKPDLTANRYTINNRLSSSNYLRSPTPVKRLSVSPVNNVDVTKNEIEKGSPPPNIEKDITENGIPNDIPDSNNEISNNKSIDNETLTVITRHTSPTPPGSSVYVRMRRADMAKTIEKVINRAKCKPLMVDKEVQSDRLDDSTRSSRFGSTARTAVTNWTYYTPNSTSYTGYAGRYSTQYSHLREPSCSSSYNDRSSRSCSKEPIPHENKSITSSIESDKEREKQYYNTTSPDYNDEKINIYDQCKDGSESEIIINVNLKLKKAKSPSSTDLVSPEIIITNSHQLPPQPPKTENNCKVKKIKTRKSSTDSSSDSSSSKKIIKKRTKSLSSNDSNLNIDKSDKVIESTKIPKKSKSSSSTSTNKKQAKLKCSKLRESNSPESSITISTQSSVSEDETVSKSKTIDNSRTSADESSLPTDISGKQLSPFSSNKNENGTEEAKSFLIRALAPVTNLFKLRHDSSENNRWLDTSNSSESTGKDVANITTESGSSKSKNNTSNIIASNDDNVVKLKGIRHIESGERAWWLESNSDNKNSSDNNELQRHQNSGNEKQLPQASSLENFETNKSGKQCIFVEEEEKPWWLDSSANIPEGVERLTPPRKSSSDSEKSEKYNFLKVRHIDSGDQKDWWLSSNENSMNTNQQDFQSGLSLSKSSSDHRSLPLRRIRHVESGERPWWLSSEKNIPEGIEKLPSPTTPGESDSSESEEEPVYPPIPPFPIHLSDDEPLGDRRSPEGLETPNEEYSRGRNSPYENHLLYRNNSNHLTCPKSAEKYISRYTDIDDILGTSGQIYSPFMDSILARRTGQKLLDDGECEEIDPTQVIIHDSTAQTPIIKKLRCRSEIIDCRDENIMRGQARKVAGLVLMHELIQDKAEDRSIWHSLRNAVNIG